MTATREVVDALYAAFAAGDGAALDELVAVDAELVATAGLPAGLGGEHRGSVSIRRDFWGRIAHEFDVVAEVAEVQPLVDGRVVVLGTYRGSSASGDPVDAAFAHVLTVGGGRLRRLVQVTDSHRWHQFSHREVAP